jgi:hypothetical protein
LIEFPAINFSFLTEPYFLAKRVVRVAEFKEIQRRICAELGRSVMVVPGSSFGQMEGRADPCEHEDFIWGSYGVPQISRRARDILASEGIDLLTAECSIRCGRKKLESHFAIQVEPVAMLTRECCERSRITYCPTCGDFFQNYPAPEMEGKYQLRKEAWPSGKHLVRLIETLDVIPSEEFVAAVQKHKLSGIRFEEYGELVSGDADGNVDCGRQRQHRESVADASSTTTTTRTWRSKEQPPSGVVSSMHRVLRDLIVDPDKDEAEKPAQEPPAAATEIARLLGSKVRPNKQHVINLTLDEPAYTFEIPLDDKRFKARVCLSEPSFSFDAKYRRGERALLEEALFCVSFNVPDAIMLTKDRVESVSKELGVSVYRQGFVEDEVVEKYLLSAPVRDCLGKIDFKPLSRLFLNPIQLEANSELSTPQACAAQVRVFLDLMNALDCARKREKGANAVRKGTGNE